MIEWVRSWDAFTAVAVFGFFWWALTAWYRGWTIKTMKAEMRSKDRYIEELEDGLAVPGATDLSRVRVTGAEQLLPDAFGDARFMLVVMDRAPENGVDTINCDRPVVWLDAESQSSWRWNDRDEVWEETTFRDAQHMAHVTAFTQDDVFVYGFAEIHHGALHNLQELNRADLTSEDGQTEGNRAVANMSRAICQHMDMASGETTWSQVWDANRAGNRLDIGGREWIDGRSPTGRRRQDPSPQAMPVQPGAPQRDNPFEDQRRPIVIDDETS